MMRMSASVIAPRKQQPMFADFIPTAQTGAQRIGAIQDCRRHRFAIRSRDVAGIGGNSSDRHVNQDSGKKSNRDAIPNAQEEFVIAGDGEADAESAEAL